MGVPEHNPDLHGNVPDCSSMALVLLDVLTDFAFPGGEQLLAQARAVPSRLRALKARAKGLGIPAIYVNDNFGHWKSDFQKLVSHCLAEESPGREFVKPLCPEDDDYFVLKPKHSGFFGTTLELLLQYLRTKHLILTGLAGNICVMFTAHDAYLRELKLSVPGDCVASATQAENDYALAHMERIVKADITPSDKIDLEAILSA